LSNDAIVGWFGSKPTLVLVAASGSYKPILNRAGYRPVMYPHRVGVQTADAE